MKQRKGKPRDRKSHCLEKINIVALFGLAELFFSSLNNEKKAFSYLFSSFSLSSFSSPALPLATDFSRLEAVRTGRVGKGLGLGAVGGGGGS